MFKKGDRVIVVREFSVWTKMGYALVGWTGTITGDDSVYCTGRTYTIEWDSKFSHPYGNLIKNEMIEKIKKEVKQYGIVKFMKGE